MSIKIPNQVQFYLGTADGEGWYDPAREVRITEAWARELAAEGREVWLHDNTGASERYPSVDALLAAVAAA